MSSPQFNLLIVDHNANDRRFEIEACRKAGFKCAFLEAESIASCEPMLGNGSIDCILLDYGSPDGADLQSLTTLHREHPYIPVIVTTRHGDEIVARNAFKNGAVDYLPKGQMHKIPLNEVIGEAIAKATTQHEANAQREELERFANILAHDLLAPAVHIANFIDILEENFSEGNTREAKEVLPYMKNSAKNLIAMVKTLADYTKAGSELSFADVELDRAVRNAVDMLQGEITLKGAEVNVGPLPVVRGNAALLTQLFQNLIANAIKFNKAKTPRVGISTRVVDGRQQVVVRDNGVGIPMEKAREIFKPFQRLHGKHDFPGTGLGLATVERILKRHGGRIWIAPPHGPGTTFIIELPPAEGHQLAAQKQGGARLTSPGSTHDRQPRKR